MKKFVLSFMLLASLGSLAVAADIIPVPVTPAGESLQSADYGGYLVSTSAFTTQASTITLPPGYSEIVVAGVIFSSGSGNGFVNFLSSAGYQDNAQVSYRVYSSSDAAGGYSTGGTIKRLPPIRSKTNVIWKPSLAEFNIISVLYSLK